MRSRSRTCTLAALLATLVVAFALGGCKDKSSSDSDKQDKKEKKEGKVASCDVIQTAQECRQYNEDNLALGDKHIKDICETMNGVFKPVACPKDKRIGVCVKAEGTTVYYQGYLVAMDKTEKYCTEAQGKWEKP
jgi:hypothetical protein